MLTLVIADITGVREEEPDWQLLEVVECESKRMGLAVCYWLEQGKCGVGDRVIINISADKLNLGTGGYHFVVAKLGAQSEHDYYPGEWGHIMKMRYTPLQLSIPAVEEQASPYHALFQNANLTLEGTPVLIGELHSLLPIFAAVGKSMRSHLNLVYVMPDGAALPIQLSRHVHQLKKRGWLRATVTAGQAWGGDLEAVNIHTGLLAAKWIADADIILCTQGPGVVGTGTPLGFSGMQLAEVMHAVTLLGGIPIVAPRIGFTDTRSRHHGMSHHTRTLLKRFVLSPVIFPIPIFGDERDVLLRRQVEEDNLAAKHVCVTRHAPPSAELHSLEKDYGFPLTTMGRSLYDEPSPFQSAAVAMQVALIVKERWRKSSAFVHDPFDQASLLALYSFLTSDGA